MRNWIEVLAEFRGDIIRILMPQFTKSPACSKIILKFGISIESEGIIVRFLVSGKYVLKHTNLLLLLSENC